MSLIHFSSALSISSQVIWPTVLSRFSTRFLRLLIKRKTYAVTGSNLPIVLYSEVSINSMIFGICATLTIDVLTLTRGDFNSESSSWGLEGWDGQCSLDFNY